MRAREASSVVLLSGLVAGWVLWPVPLQAASRLAGSWVSWGQAWGMGRVSNRIVGDGPLVIDGPVVLAGWPQLITGGLLDLVMPLPWAHLLSIWAWLMVGMIACYAAARSLGSGRLGATLGALVAGANPVVAQAVHEGWLEWLAVPLIALALWGGLAKGGDKLGAVGGAAAGLVVLQTPVLGVTTLLLGAWAALASGGRRAAAFSASGLLVAVPLAWRWRDGGAVPRPNINEFAAYADVLDFLAPFWVWREWGLHAGVAGSLALAAAAWFVVKGNRQLVWALGGAGLLGALLALGPEVRWGGGVLRPGGVGLPLPALVVELLVPSAALLNWKSALVPALAAAGFLLSRLPRGAAGAALLLVVVELALLSPCPSVDGRTPLAVHQLPPGEGAVLAFPLELGDPADEGVNMRALYLQTAHKRPLVTGMGPTQVSALLGDPLVVLAANAQAQKNGWAIPPAGPVARLRDMGVELVLIDRPALELGSLVLLDRLMARACESPQRDLAGRMDSYMLPGEGSGMQLEAMRLVPIADRPERWHDPETYLERWR